MGMLVQSTPVSFGAVGTPIIVGINTGLDTATIGAQLAANGSSWDAYLQLITTQVASIHAIVGTFMPFIMVIMLVRFFGKDRSWRAVFEVLPFALFAGLAGQYRNEIRRAYRKAYEQLPRLEPVSFGGCIAGGEPGIPGGNRAVQVGSGQLQ